MTTILASNSYSIILLIKMIIDCSLENPKFSENWKENLIFSKISSYFFFKKFKLILY